MHKPAWMPLLVAEFAPLVGISEGRVRRSIIPLIVEQGDAYRASRTGEWWINRQAAENWALYAEERSRRIASNEFPDWHSKRAWSLDDLGDCVNAIYDQGYSDMA